MFKEGHTNKVVCWLGEGKGKGGAILTETSPSTLFPPIAECPGTTESTWLAEFETTLQ